MTFQNRPRNAGYTRYSYATPRGRVSLRPFPRNARRPEILVLVPSIKIPRLIDLGGRREKEPRWPERSISRITRGFVAGMGYNGGVRSCTQPRVWISGSGELSRQNIIEIRAMEIRWEAWILKPITEPVSKFVTDSRRSFRLISIFQKGKVLERSSWLIAVRLSMESFRYLSKKYTIHWTVGAIKGWTISAGRTQSDRDRFHVAKPWLPTNYFSLGQLLATRI